MSQLIVSSPDRLELLDSEKQLGLFTIDGQSVCSKSSVLKVVYSELSGVADVQCEVAGDFFRGVTVGIYAEVGDDIGRVSNEPQTLDELIERVLNGSDAKRPKSANELNAAVIDAHVSRIGERDITQYAIQEWYDTKVKEAQAAGKDYLILDGRNPRERIKRHIEAGSAVSALDLLLYCSVSIAAERALLRASHHAKNPLPITPQSIEAKTKEIVERREIDARRKVFPYSEPQSYINYRTCDLGDGLVAKSWGNAKNGVPLTIRMDTTNLSLEHQSQKVRDLVSAAVSHPKTQ